MAVTYDPNTPWPFAVLAKFIEVREYPGFHQIYRNGLTGRPHYETDLVNMGPITNYWTCRVFMLRVDMESTGAMHLIYSNYYYGKVEINKDNKENIVSLQNNNSSERKEALVSNVKNGDIFSFGLRIVQSKELVGLANDTGGPWSYQKGIINPNDYKFKIWQGTHVLLSMHITTEESKEPYYPPNYVYPEYSEKPPGSNMIAYVELSDPSADVEFGVYGDDRSQNINYGKRTELGKHAPIFVYVRNLPGNFTLNTSFDPAPKTIQHKPNGSRNIYFYRTNATPTIKITHYILSDK